MTNPPDPDLIQALRITLAQDPANLPIRKHLASLLHAAGDYPAAEIEYREVLTLTPNDQGIKRALGECFFHQSKYLMALVVFEELLKAPAPQAQTYLLAARAYLATNQTKEAEKAYTAARKLDPSLKHPDLDTAFNQDAAQDPASETPKSDDLPPKVLVTVNESAGELMAEIERANIAFKDVGGMEALKEEIRLKIIHPLSHPEIYKSYGKSVGGGILMYGPPGCGKTHLARATAGECSAYFISVGIHDVLDMYLGQSEQKLHALFETARRYTPCVLFFDEVDALGANRTDMRRSAGRQVINQFLSELDGIDNVNDGVLVLAATNAPWHLDPALRRPGRFDRVIFVPPPDLDAREAILQIMLSGKPTHKIDFEGLARKTPGYSGADLKAIVDIAVETKLMEAMRTGTPDPITNADLNQGLKRQKASTRDWFSTARNYALYSNQSGLYDEILDYLNIKKDDDLLSKVTNWWKK